MWGCVVFLVFLRIIVSEVYIFYLISCIIPSFFQFSHLQTYFFEPFNDDTLGTRWIPSKSPHFNGSWSIEDRKHEVYDLGDKGMHRFLFRKRCKLFKRLRPCREICTCLSWNYSSTLCQCKSNCFRGTGLHLSATIV